MDKRIADIYDIVGLILVLVICLPVGLGTTVRDYHEIKNYEADYTDKTAYSSYSGTTTKVYGEYNGTLTKDEVLLMSQIQDDEAMRTDTIDYKKGSSSFKQVTGSSREGVTDYVPTINSLYRDDDPENGGYRIKYDPKKDEYTVEYEQKQ